MQTHEVEFIMSFFHQLKLAKKTGVYAPVERLIAPDARLLTAKGEHKGAKEVLEHLKEMEKQRYHMDIVAPKGGLVTVLVAPVSYEGLPIGRGREQVYRILDEKLIELIDIGRTPQQVNRPESQPN